MTYLNIFCDSISHFTAIPKEQVESFIAGAMKRKVNGAQLLTMLLELRMPDNEGIKICEQLKSQSLAMTISFMASLMSQIKFDVERQASLN